MFFEKLAVKRLLNTSRETNKSYPRDVLPSFAEEYEDMSTILVTEDDETIGRFLLDAIAQETPHEFVLATDSVQALRIAQEVKPDLFILNYHLPHMNGIELYDRLHSMEELHHIPAIMVSAALPKEEVKQRHIIGITKPFDLNTLLNSIEQLLA